MDNRRKGDNHEPATEIVYGSDKVIERFLISLKSCFKILSIDLCQIMQIRINEQIMLFIFHSVSNLLYNIIWITFYHRFYHDKTDTSTIRHNIRVD
jgi:hypothetical protein